MAGNPIPLWGREGQAIGNFFLCPMPYAQIIYLQPQVEQLLPRQKQKQKLEALDT